MDRTNRKYFTPIFMGAGETSSEQCYMLHKKLEKIFELMSGLQQSSHAASEDEADADERQYERDTRKLKILVLNFMSDLGFSLEELIEHDLYKDMMYHNKIIDDKNKVSR
jgi:hypothetical protein